LSAQPKGKIKFVSGFVDGTKTQSWFFSAPQNSVLTVKVQGKKGEDLLPDFVVQGAQGEPNAIAETQAKKFSADHRTVSEKGIQLLLAGNGVYELVLASTGGDPGYYTLTLDI
jgi:hypothetical protein